MTLLPQTLVLHVYVQTLILTDLHARLHVSINRCTFFSFKNMRGGSRLLHRLVHIQHQTLAFIRLMKRERPKEVKEGSSSSRKQEQSKESR